jgi:signal transduction histidine kinase
VNGDAEQLNQVFVNLLLNAIEATPAGGLINVSASVLPESGMIRVSVSDTGPGIAPEIMGRLFEPFATTRAKGTGLGLPICHRIVTEHKGSIIVENMEQGGARLIVDLPAASPASGVREPDVVMSSPTLQLID